MIHKEGIKIVFTYFLLLLSIIVITYFLLAKYIVLKIIVSSINFAAIILITRFFRNPKRNIIPNENIIVSPADGTIVTIEETFEDEYFKEKRLQISIFMSIYNVHVNRYPISGNIIYTKYHNGKYLVAKRPKSSLDNERSTTVIKPAQGQAILVRQIAGFIARRIINYARPKLCVNQGDDLGFIRFGSRVDLFFPLNTKLNIKLGDKVKGNKTIIAEI